MILFDLPCTPNNVMLFCAGFWGSILVDRLALHVTRQVARRRLHSAISGSTTAGRGSLSGIPDSRSSGAGNS